MSESAPDPAQRRLLGLVATGVIGVALVGFLTGTSGQDYHPALSVPVRGAPSLAEVPPARSHAELEREPWKSGAEASGWRRAQAIPSAATRPAALADRAARRAFDGAPPVIPHPVRAGGASECLACHRDGFALGAARANPIPHAELASCTQCHVVAAPFTRLPPSPAASVDNGFEGLERPVDGATAYRGAPPAIPHSTWMRERCGACHGSGAVAELRTPHPERQSCLQCHPATGESQRASR